MQGQREEGWKDGARQGLIGDEDREEEKEEEEAGMQRRAEPAGAAEPPPRRTLGRSGSACGDPPVPGPVPPGAAVARRGAARRGAAVSGGAGCEPRGEGEERVRACVCHPRVRVSVGDAGRDVRVPRARVGAAGAHAGLW